MSLPRIIPATPVGQSLPGHRSSRPYTIFELEQVRQQSRKYAAESHAGLLREAETGGGGASAPPGTPELAPAPPRTATTCPGAAVPAP